ncbi:MAG: protein-L-isoaspartate(D-aspartate) O-methyltransferase [Bacteroidales bacterium]|nr:protein-L-isoaspartate(D-aspartate) O-methyltransferase [Bacteroidales bacterium]
MDFIIPGIGGKAGWHSVTILFVMMACTHCSSQEPAKDDYERLRGDMVKWQIEARGVRDAEVLRAMRRVERHQFVPTELRHLAYEDHPLPIGEDQTISQPYIVALMTEVLDLGKSSRVLEVGTGSGYQAAVLAEICDSVFTMEIFESLGKSAEEVLHRLGYRNVSVRIGDGYQGWPEQAPFDAIIVTCAPTHVPEPLREQLAEGGRMVIPVGKAWSQELILLKKSDGRLRDKEVIPVRFVPMIDKSGKAY